MADGTTTDFAPSAFLAKRVPPVWQFRIQLQEKFFADLYEDFSVHGKEALAKCRAKYPAKYLAIIAALMPKEIEYRAPLEGLNDDELLGAVSILRERIAAGAFGAGSRAEPALITAQVDELQPVSETAGIP